VLRYRDSLEALFELRSFLFFWFEDSYSWTYREILFGTRSLSLVDFFSLSFSHEVLPNPVSVWTVRWSIHVCFKMTVEIHEIFRSISTHPFKSVGCVIYWLFVMVGRLFVFRIVVCGGCVVPAPALPVWSSFFCNIINIHAFIRRRCSRVST